MNSKNQRENQNTSQETDVQQKIMRFVEIFIQQNKWYLAITVLFAWIGSALSGITADVWMKSRQWYIAEKVTTIITMPDETKQTIEHIKWDKIHIPEWAKVRQESFWINGKIAWIIPNYVPYSEEYREGKLGSAKTILGSSLDNEYNLLPGATTRIDTQWLGWELEKNRYTETDHVTINIDGGDETDKEAIQSFVKTLPKDVQSNIASITFTPKVITASDHEFLKSMVEKYHLWALQTVENLQKSLQGWSVDLSREDREKIVAITNKALSLQFFAPKVEYGSGFEWADVNMLLVMILMSFWMSTWIWKMSYESGKENAQKKIYESWKENPQHLPDNSSLHANEIEEGIKEWLFMELFDLQYSILNPTIREGITGNPTQWNNVQIWLHQLVEQNSQKYYKKMLNAPDISIPYKQIIGYIIGTEPFPIDVDDSVRNIVERVKKSWQEQVEGFIVERVQQRHLSENERKAKIADLENQQKQSQDELAKMMADLREKLSKMS